MFCLNCGAKNDDGAKFCTTCGAPLAGAAQPSPQPAPTPQSEALTTPLDEPTQGAAYPSEVPAPPIFSEEPSQPPQEWPDYSDQGPVQEGGRPKKGLGTGAIVGIIVGALVVIALIVTAVLFATGTISLGGGSGESPAAEEPSGDAEINGLGKGLSDVSGSGSVEATDVSGTIFDLAAYDASPAEIEDFLQSSGLELSGSWASSGSDYTEPYANVTFSGTYDGDMPIEMDGNDLSVTVQANIGSTPVTWDEDGYADDFLASLDDLAEDAQVTGISIEFNSTVEASGFAGAAHTLFASMGLPDVVSVSASDEDILASSIAEFGLAESDGDTADYIGDVLFADGGSFTFRGREASCQVSLMGGEDFGNSTMVEVGVYS